MIAREFTFDNVRRCAQGLATYLLENGGENQSVVVGFDKRFHSENFGAAAAEVLAGNGLTVYLTAGATPTPVISHAVKAKGAAGAVNITASHNPPIDNGFKVRDEHGGAIPPDDLLKIEKAIPADMNGVKSLDIDKGLKSKKIVTFEPAEDYIRHIKTLIDFQPLMDAGLNIVVDSMWGNGAGWFTNLIGGGKTKIVEFHDVRNPIYPEMDRPEPIPPNVDAGLSKLLEEKGDALVILDGDADRVGIGDEKGEFVNQLRVYGLLAYYLLEVKGERGPIVKTLSTTTMLNKLGKIYDVPVYETGVGFKYVAPKMLEVDAMIGGEESGGYAFRGNVPDRDGILGG
ncbi:MAG: phosphoglucomutase/phosphomannomutase family protein, partial [Anaerolineae bacterium]|nr:phosphoglucomutase/phosphomannomutase family protein [Anaerolineae bacterium]